MRTRIKICGITRPEDALAAVAAGADAIGLVFHPDSPRHVDPSAAREIVRQLPPFISTVGLFLNPEAQQVRRILEQVDVDLLQFHGTETAEFCAQFRRTYVKAVAMAGGVDPAEAARAYPDAAAFLLDSHAPGEQGGTGEVFDWESFPRRFGRPLILAGGLRPENVAEAVARCRPYAVDVSSGVEEAPGIKSRDRMIAFAREVRRGEDV